MPNVYCCVIGCSSSTYQLNKWTQTYCELHGCFNGTDRCTCAAPFRLFPFPSDDSARNQWLIFVNRKDSQHQWKRWNANKYSRLCSRHFIDGCPTDIHPHPTLNPGYKTSKSIPKCRTPRVSKVSSTAAESNSVISKPSHNDQQIADIHPTCSPTPIRDIVVDIDIDSGAI